MTLSTAMRFTFVNCTAKFIGLILAFFCAGCSNQKVTECKKLIEPINDGHTLVTNFQGKDAPAASKVADDLDKITTKLERLNLKDTKLKAFQKDFTQIYKNLSQAFRNTALALITAKSAEVNQKGMEELRNAKEQVKLASKTAADSAQKADQLAFEINNYCTGTANN